MADDGVLRVGRLRIALDCPDARYVDFVDTHLHTVLAPLAADDRLDLRLRIVEEDAAPPPADVDDPLRVTATTTAIAVHTHVVRIDVDRTTAPATGVVRVRPSGRPPAQVLGLLVLALNRLLATLGPVRLHAAAVVVGDRTALLVGDKGAGKSTTCLAQGRLGATVLSDDQIALERIDGRITVAGSDDRVRLTEPTERHFFPDGLDAPVVDSAGVAKKQLHLADLVPHADPFVPYPLTDLCFPRVGTGFAVTPLRGRQALARLLGSLVATHRFADDADRLDLLELLADAVDGARCWEVELSPELDDQRLLHRHLAAAT